MLSADLPADESDRLQALRASGLLHSGPDPRLDAIVRRVAALFAAPLAAISLLDETTQYFKASIGLGVPFTHRDVAFCGFAILQPAPLVVLDARSDTRFAENALVIGAPDIRFYAGTPVYGPGQQPLGALCVMDIRPRTDVVPELLNTLLEMAAEVSTIFKEQQRHYAMFTE